MGTIKILTTRNKHILEPLAMFALSVFLFVLAYHVEIETLHDRIIVPFTYVCALLCLIIGIYMCLPIGRKMSVQADEIRRQEKVTTLEKFKTDPLRFTLQKTVISQLPMLVVCVVLYVTGTFSSFPTLLVAWCGIVLLYFFITYFYLKFQTTKNSRL